MKDNKHTLEESALKIYDNALKKWQVVQYEEQAWCVFRVPDDWNGEGIADSSVETLFRFTTIEAAHDFVRLKVITEVVHHTEFQMLPNNLKIRGDGEFVAGAHIYEAKKIGVVSAIGHNGDKYISVGAAVVEQVDKTNRSFAVGDLLFTVQRVVEGKN